jgi:hypothetical protein
VSLGDSSEVFASTPREGPYFPWAVPGLYAQGKSDVEPVSYAIVLLTGAAGIWGTHLWWKYADQNR